MRADATAKPAAVVQKLWRLGLSCGKGWKSRGEFRVVSHQTNVIRNINAVGGNLRLRRGYFLLGWARYTTCDDCASSRNVAGQASESGDCRDARRWLRRGHQRADVLGAAGSGDGGCAAHPYARPGRCVESLRVLAASGKTSLRETTHGERDRPQAGDHDPERHACGRDGGRDSRE